ncbi:MAG: orotate phosphoribosyltransferase [Rhodobiaceae bacterium]|nr:orotate phosphoribosyltransferase [Rhodobiaceae bacterium]|tara:strand:+ start:860 stop:1444 length:585 start_codon:yes stop_codon:yes gene_type:complete
MNKDDVIREFKEAGALLDGHFILSSGLHSSKYLQCALALSEPSRAQRLSSSLGKKILENIKTKIDIVVSPAMGGLIIGHEIARYLNVPSIFLERIDGKFKLRRGFSIKLNANCLLVEDIVTTGLSSNESIDVIKRHGGNIIGEACLIDRSSGKANLETQLISLASIDIPTFDKNDIPESLKEIPAIKPGSRNIT